MHVHVLPRGPSRVDTICLKILELFRSGASHRASSSVDANGKAVRFLLRPLETQASSIALRIPGSPTNHFREGGPEHDGLICVAQNCAHKGALVRLEAKCRLDGLHDTVLW